MMIGQKPKIMISTDYFVLCYPMEYFLLLITHRSGAFSSELKSDKSDGDIFIHPKLGLKSDIWSVVIYHRHF